MFQISVNFMAFWLSYLTYNMVVLCFDVPLHYLEHEEHVLDIWTHLCGEQHLVEGVEVVELAGHKVTDMECSGAGLLLPGQVL